MSIILAQALLRDDLEIKTAFLSVYDKEGLEDLAMCLVAHNVKLIATGGTFDFLEKAKVPVFPLSVIAPFPEILGGRVKTLQPQVAGGILANKAVPEQLDVIRRHGIAPIDMVVCNFYPFEKVAATDGATVADMVENIDIGGPNMVREAGKNFGSVCVVPIPNCYQIVMKAMRENKGTVPYTIRTELVKLAFNIVAAYDVAIARTLSARLGKDESTMPLRKSRA